jgi:hypothetical protein
MKNLLLTQLSVLTTVAPKINHVQASAGEIIAKKNVLPTVQFV